MERCENSATHHHLQINIDVLKIKNINSLEASDVIVVDNDVLHLLGNKISPWGCFYYMLKDNDQACLYVPLGLGSSCSNPRCSIQDPIINIFNASAQVPSHYLEPQNIERYEQECNELYAEKVIAFLSNFFEKIETFKENHRFREEASQPARYLQASSKKKLKCSRYELFKNTV